jgi:hypothetical protein
MHDQAFSIVPPPDLVEQWANDSVPYHVNAIGKEWEIAFAARAARWGADQELEACCEWFQEFYKTESWGKRDLKHFRAARRPKPQTLNSIALQMLGTIERDNRYLPEIIDTIKRALKENSDD